ncbi:glycosyltransferase [Flavobacterium sp. j3]|uniref:Glycosyltransferase n=1 Tax=Flavobacterium aureirubrum TaxID=3133147 RepID=A0ABU9N2K1_9FLAO
MTFCIITHVPHGYHANKYFAYAPYVREINIWSKYVDRIVLVAPLQLQKITPIEINYTSSAIDFHEVNSFNFLSLKAIFSSLVELPKVVFKIYFAMKAADHIHLRCPGNMGLLGCMVQVFFPSKSKTAKYAGNWDLKSRQPLSYRLQKWILSNTFLTKNINVLVYGEWENSSKNIKPFFTASYYNSDKTEIKIRSLKSKISFLFVGTLSNGKQPLYAIQLVERIYHKGFDVQLNLYGEGQERLQLEKYISDKKLESFVFLQGNQNQKTVKEAYLNNHFVILPSMSEGWPKVVAEGMFWGCLPIATSVSCVPNMLDNGNRGLLLTLDIKDDVKKIMALINDESLYYSKTKNAVLWSRNYTLDVFEEEIKTILQS